MTNIKIIGLRQGKSTKNDKDYFVVYWSQKIDAEKGKGSSVYTSFVNMDEYNKALKCFEQGKEASAVVIHGRDYHTFSIAE